ncbi:MAG: hypothetical protein E7249_16240 [Paenibacillaceae bacterium]|nr:hypothetical protein [Paenibacillaceae bacterium]
MEGRIIFINSVKGYGEIDTQNDTFKRLRFYLNKLKISVQIDDTVSFEIKTSQAGNKYATNLIKVQRNKSKYNTEDKPKWYAEGESKEFWFIREIEPRLDVDLIINPEKKVKPWVIDFYDKTNNKYADLKTQNTPFFTAKKYKYGEIPYDPTYTVTFNRKDYEYYKLKYQDSDIYWNIKWEQLEYKGEQILYVNGIWRSKFQNLLSKIEKGEVYLHQYEHRVNDDKNAKDSYLFDLRDQDVFERLI